MKLSSYLEQARLSALSFGCSSTNWGECSDRICHKHRSEEYVGFAAKFLPSQAKISEDFFFFFIIGFIIGNRFISIVLGKA